MAQKSRTIPCLDKLRFQEKLERGDLFLGVKGFERLVVEFPILLMKIEDLACIMVRDIGIFHLPRMISKLNDIAIERRLKFGDILDVQILPRQENFIVFVHTHASL